MTERRIELNHVRTGTEHELSESRGKGIEMVHASPADSVPFPAPAAGDSDDGAGQAPVASTSAAAPDFDD